MGTVRKPLGLTVIVGLAVLGVSTPRTLGQSSMMFGMNAPFQVRRGPAFPQGTFNTAVLGQAFAGPSPFARNFNSFTAPTLSYPGLTSPYANPNAALYANLYGSSAYPSGGYGQDPSGGYNSAYGSGYGDPFGGYLRGTADVINAEGRVLVNIEQSSLMREQVRRERLANRRRAFDQYLYERDRAPTPEDDRQKALAEQLKRSRNDPPLGDITSAAALNSLLADVQKTDNTQRPTVSLDPEVLRHINIKSPSGRASPGLLKDEGRCRWPVVFHGPQYQAERDTLGDLTPLAYEQAVNGEVAADTLESLTRAVRQLQDKLRENIKDLTPTEYGEGRRFLSAYEDGLALLRQPGAGEYFRRKAPRGQTIAELVRHMTQLGLVFAPALPGDEAAYLAVHRALAVYDAADSGGRLASKR